jgi:hypothetical protein
MFIKIGNIMYCEIKVIYVELYFNEHTDAFKTIFMTR